MNIFELADYRELLSAYLDGVTNQYRGRRTVLAQQLGVHTSQLSQVLSGKRSLTPDQGLTISRLIGLSHLETEYLMFLVHRERATSYEFKKYCDSRLLELQQQSMKISERFAHHERLNEEDQAEFYSHHLYSAIRLFCSVDNKGQSVETIQNRFQLSREHLMPIIRFLLRTGLLKESNGQYSMGISTTVLSRESPHIHRHHANWRLLAAHQSPRLNEAELMFTSPMSVSKKDFKRIKEMLLAEISAVSKIIQDSPAEDVGCLNVDLFWVKN